MDYREAIQRQMDAQEMTRPALLKKVGKLRGLSAAKLSRFFDGQTELSVPELDLIAGALNCLPGDLVPNSSGMNPQIARINETLAGFTDAERSFLLTALQCMVEMRGATLYEAMKLYRPQGAPMRAPEPPDPPTATTMLPPSAGPYRPKDRRAPERDERT